MRYICIAFAVAVALVAKANVSEDATVLSIGTAGPDRYADGKTVLDGECYALVWRAHDHAFAGFTAGGSVVEPDYARLLCIAPLAAGGCCPETRFVIDSRVLAACGAGGTYGLYLLDSRRWDKGGNVSVGGAQGIHGSVLVSETTSVEGFLAGTASGAAAFLASAVPGVGSPTITGIRVEGDDVVISVTNTASSVNYNVAGGESVAADGKGASAQHPVAGGAKATDVIELRVKRAKFGDRAFFRIVRNPLEVKE